MRSKCRCSYVLQFTFRRAVSCVLHRPPSQVIHCIVLFFNVLHFSVQHAKIQQNRLVQIPSRGTMQTRAKATCVFKLAYLCTGHWRATGGAVPSDVAGHSVGRATRPSPEARAGAQADYSKQSKQASRFSNSLMILPQVHLRKPCYDFYFL